jgi:hypothetical protein
MSFFGIDKKEKHRTGCLENNPSDLPGPKIVQYLGVTCGVNTVATHHVSPTTALLRMELQVWDVSNKKPIRLKAFL